VFTLHTPVQPHRRYWDRWLMMGTIGVVIGLVAYLLYVVGACCHHSHVQHAPMWKTYTTAC
jgi:hypothetical protein